MPLPANNSLTSLNATVSKLGQRQNRSSLVRQLFHRTSQAVAILTVMKKGKRATAFKNKPVVIKTFHQWRKTPLSIAMGFAVLILAPQVHADNKITNAGATFGVIKEKNWINTAGSADFYVYSILVSPEQRSGSNAAEYRSINVPSRASDDAIFYINLDDQHNQINPSNSSTVFDMTTSKFRNSQTDSDWTDVGPSIYNIVANWDPTQYGNKIDMSVGAVWLDVTKWESGYIYQEINDPDSFNGYGGGYGHIPGIINIVNRGCNIAGIIESVCMGIESSGRSPNAKGGNISMLVIGGTNGGKINVAGEIGYLAGQGEAVPSVMSTSLPWRAAGASISLTANGGRAYGEISDSNLSSGDGGDIDFEVSDYFFNVGAFTGLKTNDKAPYAVLSAVSRGGTIGSASLLSNARVLGKNELDSFVFQGDGGVVSVQVRGSEINSLQDTSYVIGIVAASLGGSTQQFPYGSQSSEGVQPGMGGDVNVTFEDYSLINLPYNNSIGIVAASTADTMILTSGNQQVRGNFNHYKKKLSTPGDVTVTLGMYSEIFVGDKGLKANAVSHADTNIGVLAISSGGWARETFTGANLDHVMPNLVGNVTVLNAGNVTVYGPNASGVLVQSIGGGSISSPGLASVGGTSLDLTIEKHTSFSTSDGGNVTYSSTAESESGGFIKAQGDGATALLLQSIGGGGGAGGNATGLFVAVGGNGGEGGHGGSVDVTLTDQQIFAKGDYAKGVIAHSIGGGGGSGGHAKAFSLLSVLPSVGIGGSGGEGGNGGDLTFTAVNGSVTTAGQHAMGLTFQSIGGGGGTGGAVHNYSASIGFTIEAGVGGSGGEGGAGGALTVTLDNNASITTTGLDSHGVLMQTISGGGGAGGAASGTTYNAGQIPDVPLNVNVSVNVGGSGGSSETPGFIKVMNDGTISTSGAGSHGLVLQSIGGGGGHGADSTSGTNTWGVLGDNPGVNFSMSTALGGSGGAAGDGGEINLTSRGTITTWGHNSIGVLAHSVGGGGGIGGQGNAYANNGWVGNKSGEGQATTLSITTTLGAGGDGAAGGNGGPVRIAITKKGQVAPSFFSIGAGSSAIVAQSVGGGGGMAGDAGTQSINGGKVDIGMQLGGSGGNGGHGDTTTVGFDGNIQTGAVVRLQYENDNGQTQLSSPVTIGSSSHGIVAQSIGGGGGIGGNADPTAALIPTLNKLLSNWPKPVDKVLHIKDGINFWAKRAVEDADRPKFEVSYTTNLSLGGSGGNGGGGGDVEVTIGKSDITTYGHHSFAVLAQSVGGGGGLGGNASANSILSGDVSASSLGKDISVGTAISLGGSAGTLGDGKDVKILLSNPLDTNYQPPNIPADGTTYARGNYIRTGGYASHALFAQSVGGGGGIGHEGSIIGLASVQGVKTPSATLGHATQGVLFPSNGGQVYIGSVDENVVGWVETAGDASSALLAQSIGGGGGTISFGCTSNGRSGSRIIKHSPCFTDAEATWDGGDTASFSAQEFVNTSQKFDLTLNTSFGSANTVEVNLGEAHLVTDGDRSIAIVAQSIGGGGGYISADAQNVGDILQSEITTSASFLRLGGSVTVRIGGDQGGSGSTYIGTYGDGAWGVLAQSIGGGGGLLGDTSLDIVGNPKMPTAISSSPLVSSAGIKVSMSGRTILHTYGTNAHGIVAQSWSNGGGVFAGSQQDPAATLVLGSKLSDSKLYSGDEPFVSVSVGADSEIVTQGDGSIGIIAQANGGKIEVDILGSVSGGKTYTNTLANNRVVQGIGVLISGGVGGDHQLTVHEGGSVTTQDQTVSGFALVADSVTINNAGTMTGSKDLGVNSELNNLTTGVLNTGAVYKVGNNSLHNYGTINIGDEDSVSTTNLEGRFFQYDTGRLLVTFDSLADQTHDRLIVDGTVVLGGSFETRAKSLLPGDYAFLTATDLTVTADAVDRLLYDWNVKVTDTGVTATPNSAFRTEGLNLSPTSQNLVSYLERAWDNADRHHAALFGYKHELEGIEDYNSLLEGLSGQALNAQPLQMRMMALTSLGDGMSCPVVTPMGLSLGQDNCVWARLTGDLSNLTGDSSNLGYRASGGGLRIGVQHKVDGDWTVGVSLGYGLNDLTATNFSSNGEFFDASVSATRRLGQLSLGGSLAFAQGWFDNSRQVKATAAGIAPGFNRQYDSDSRQSVYAARLRAAYTFEQEESHYIRPYLDLDLIYSESSGFNESGAGELALRKGSSSQFNVGISPMVEFGSDFLTEDKTRVKVFVSAGATFLPNNNQTMVTSFVGASAANGTFDVVTNGPDVLGRLNLGVEVFQSSGFQVRAQYGLQAGQNYLSQSLSANLVYRF